MKMFRLALVVIFMSAFTIVACSDDESPTDTGTPDQVNSSNVCDQEFCATNPTKQQECQTFLNNCLNSVGSGRDDECIGGAYLICAAI